MKVHASVVVPTYKRPILLERCLEALLAQEPGVPFEVVVVDDADEAAARGRALAWARRFGRRKGARLHYVPVRGPHGPAVARNRGWRAAAAPLIAFTDDDCVPRPGWLGAGVRALSAGADAAWGRLLMPIPDRPTDYERDAAGLSRAEFVTANCFCRRDALEAAGGFDEKFTAAWREDSDLYFTLLERGLRVAHAPDAEVVHPVRPAAWGVSVGQQRKSRFEALLYKKHPALYREKIRPGRPWPYYAILASIIASAGLVAAGRDAAALGAAGLWLWFTAAFCARRLRGTSRAPRHVAEMLATSIVIPPLSVFWRLRGAMESRTLFI